MTGTRAEGAGAPVERELATDILIVGGGTGGVAAALAVARAGGSCIMTEPTAWIGGQLTSQAVPPDENRWIESFGGTCLYREFRTRVRDWYRAHRVLTASARDNPHLNPGGGWVSRLCCEPCVAHEVLLAMLAPHVQSGRVRVRLGVAPVACDPVGDRVRAVTVEDAAGRRTVITARFLLDATELGDLYELGLVEHMIGSDARSTFGELHAPNVADPLDQQAISWCFALEHLPGESHVLPRPARYDFWRNFVPTMASGDAPWTGPLFSWTVPSHNQEGRRTFPFLPWPEHCPEGVWDMWRYRRIVDASQHEPVPGAAPVRDVTLINMVQMDYWLKPLLGVTPEAQKAAMDEAKELSRCLVYWMQTEAPHLDAAGHEVAGKRGWPGLRLRGDELGTTDGFAMTPYIREPRRLLARTVVTEAHIGTEQRRAEGKPRMDATPMGSGEPFADSVGIGHYALDLHPSCSGRNSVYVPAAPFRIPLGALIPVRCRNLIAAGKGIGVTHITNGCYRMHHTEWNIGESAGALAAWCVARDTEPHAVHHSAEAVREFQRELTRVGVVLTWPWEA